MKLNKDKQIDFQSNAVFEGYDAKISEENMHKLWDLLQDPYKNSIGAVVREYVSNSFDSHAEAEFIKNNTISSIRNEYSIYQDISDNEINSLKNNLKVFNNDAVVVSMGKDDTGRFWATEDFGVGLSPDRVKDVFCSYLKSTKEDTNNVIGAFGIGSKSGLSYTDIVFIRTRYNGTEAQYMLRKGEKSPRLDIVSTKPTDKRNGTEIKIYIKNHDDVYKFKEECKKQLAYFDNVYFNGCEVDNNYTIVKGINWAISSNGNPFSGLHMCLGKVAYPIDWDALSAEKLCIDIALTFEIGELDIIQTREDVKYTPRTKKAILDKIELLRKELIERYQNTINIKTDDLLFYLENRHDNPKITYTVDNFQFHLELYDLYRESSYSYRDISPEIKQKIGIIEYKPFSDIGLDLSSTNNYDFFMDYKCNNYINSSGLKHSSRGVYNLFRSNYCVYRIKSDHITRKSKYIANGIEGKEVYLIRTKTSNEIKLKNYVKYLNLDWDDRANWRKKILVFQKEIRKFLIQNTKSYEDVVVDPQWIKDNYGSKRTYDSSKMSVQYYDGSSWYKGNLVKGDIFKKKKVLFIMGLKEHKDHIQFMDLFYNRMPRKFKFIGYVAPTNLNIFIKDAANLVTMENFRKTKPFIRTMTVYHIAHSDKYKNIYHLLSNSRVHKLKDLNPDFKFIESLYSYIGNNRKDFHNWRYSDFFKEAYQYALEEDIFDKEIINQIECLKEYFDLPLFDILDLERVDINEDFINSLAELIYRYNKTIPKSKFRRLNPMYYINYNQQELEWMGNKNKNVIQKIQMR